MNREDLFWLAGWLEGEGSFVGSSNGQTRCVIRAASTDLDVIEKVAKLLGSNVIEENKRPKGKEHWKTVYYTMLCGEKAKNLMLEMYPLMGNRRQMQIDSAVNNYKPHEKKFNVEVVSKIRALSNSVSQSEIARMFDTNRTTINKIINNKYKV